jgi:membrane fusion protein, multidrug efflux system
MSTSSVAVVLGAVGVLATASSLGACDGAKPPPAPPPPAQVGFVVVEKRDVALYIEAVGTLDGYVNADIRARVRGYLERQHYQDGSQVAAGQVLFSIEPTEYQAAAKSANANLARARVGLAKNKLDRDRDQDLVKAGMASRQDLDNASAAVADAEAQVSAAEAQVQQAGLNLGYTTIRSPLAGVAGLALVRVGNLVGQDGPTLLTTVSQLDPIRVNFPLSEIDYVRYPERFAHLEGRDLAWARQEFARLDQQPEVAGVEIALADGRLYPHRGAIVAVNRQIDATGTTQLQALVPNPDGVLRPGEYARVRIRRENEGKGVVVVPEKALVSVQGSYSVAEIGPDNKVQMRRIELGAGTPGFRVVTSGLSGGEHIVVDGLQRVTDGAIVAPHPAPPPAATPPAAGSAAPPAAGSAAALTGKTAAAPTAPSTRAN